jgi:transposase InsO family protein
VRLVSLVNPNNFLLLIQLDVLQDLLNSSTKCVDSPIPSTNGCRYYVLFVDDYSRFTWVYHILYKSEVFQCFVKFKLLVENLFTTKIKQFQFDNGVEYTSKQFKDYLSQSGILHRLSCPHTSQQNGIAERKHRHIVEVGLTLLAQSGLSPKF